MNTFQDAENRINRVGIETFVSQAFESVRLDSDSESKNPLSVFFFFVMHSIPRILSLSPAGPVVSSAYPDQDSQADLPVNKTCSYLPVKGSSDPDTFRHIL